ncbi:MAG: Acetyltransferase domain [Actinomycetota bacterium]|jgi:N-acetylglutamate synthase-like GNAT family acetyltransferase|nr:Acetyltransferase domain [Actinomycetota bacterium]
MFVTRATRHDKSDVQELWDAAGSGDSDVNQGKIFIARDGAVVGTVRMIEVAPQTVVVDDVVVREDRRKEGIGRQLMQTALNSIGGKLFLCCHEDKLQFYGHFGFAQVDKDELPEPVASYLSQTGDLDPPEGHVHFFLTAR